MAKTVDKISSLIAPKYFNWIREAILKHGKINIRALARALGILDGNTYFRNFIEDNQQDYLGISGLTSVLDKCGYELVLVPIKKTDNTSFDHLSKISKDSFSDICEKIGELAEGVKRSPRIEKVKKSTVIKNSNIINDSIMGIDSNYDSINDYFDDDEVDDGDDLAIGTSTIFDITNLKIDLNSFD